MAKKTTAKKNNFGADLIAGMKTVVAHQRGEIEIEQVWPKPVDVTVIAKEPTVVRQALARERSGR